MLFRRLTRSIARRANTLRRAFGPTERALRRLSNEERYVPGNISLGGMDIAYPDGPSLAAIYHEIFVRQIYKFNTKHERPVIIDGGANIGLCALYCHQRFNNGRIIAFEPDPKIFDYLERNTASIPPASIALHRKALWNSEGTLNFCSEGADAGRAEALSPGMTGSVTRTVDCVRLRDYLCEPVAFLKLDIEGAETEVILDCADLLGNVEQLFVEYHSFEGRSQTLSSLLAVLRDANFRVAIDTVPGIQSPNPFIARHCSMGMDLQLNIFAYRPE